MELRQRNRTGVLISYRLDGLDQSRMSRFVEKVLGVDRKVGGRSYRRRGFLDDIPHWKVNRGVLLVQSKDRHRVVKALREWTHNVEWWEVVLTRRQEQRLHSKPSG